MELIRQGVLGCLEQIAQDIPHLPPPFGRTMSEFTVNQLATELEAKLERAATKEELEAKGVIGSSRKLAPKLIGGLDLRLRRR
jgi:hypothetical protein